MDEETISQKSLVLMAPSVATCLLRIAQLNKKVVRHVVWPEVRHVVWPEVRHVVWPESFHVLRPE